MFQSPRARRARTQRGWKTAKQVQQQQTETEFKRRKKAARKKRG